MDGKLIVVFLPTRKIYDLSKELQKDFPALTSRQQNTWCWKLVVAKNISNETFHMASFVFPHGAFLTSKSWSFSSLLSHADINVHCCFTSWADTALRCSFKGACSPRAEMNSKAGLCLTAQPPHHSWQLVIFVPITFPALLLTII